MYINFPSAIALCALAFLAACDANPHKRATANPIMKGVNFPDPAIIKTPSGWHLFSTNAKVDGKMVHIQRAVTTDWKSFSFKKGVDALPNLPSWVDPTPRVWAPDVIQLNDGSFMMYYTAAYRRMPHLHCLSYATARKITDPFVDTSKEPWICPTAKGGAIDIAGFADERNGGKRWVVYKVDGNAIGHGGACGNTVKPIVPTPILLQQVAQDGHTLIGSPKQILTNIASDGPYVEAPVLTYMNGKYVLFFSSQCYQTNGYDVQYAIADKITGPYTRKGRLFGTGTMGMKAPGGLDIAINGNKAIWHGYVYQKKDHIPSESALIGGPILEFDGGKKKKEEKCKSFERKADCYIRRNYQKVRAAYVATLTLKNDKITAKLD